jgi:hypothetical protein
MEAAERRFMGRKTIADCGPQIDRNVLHATMPAVFQPADVLRIIVHAF